MPEPFLVDATVAAHYVTEHLDRPCTAGLIRRWASDRQLTRYGKPGRTGVRTLYSLDEVHKVALAKRVYHRCA